MHDADCTTVEADGLTHCCRADTTFHDLTECCKVCWREVLNPAEGFTFTL